MFIKSEKIGDPKKITEKGEKKKTYTQKSIKPLFSHIGNAEIESKVFRASELPEKVDRALKRTKIRPISKKQGIKLKEYKIVRDKYMEEHIGCEFKYCSQASEDLHHMAGRTGDLLTDTRYFMAVCREHHLWIHNNPKESLENGYTILRSK